MFPSSRRVAAGITCLLPGDTLPLINRRHSTHNQPVVTTTTTRSTDHHHSRDHHQDVDSPGEEREGGGGGRGGCNYRMIAGRDLHPSDGILTT